MDASPNGGVLVEGWDRDSAHVVVRIQASARTEAAAREIASRVTAERRGDELISGGPENLSRRSWWSVTYVVFVPSRTNLTLEAVNGPLSVDDVNSRMDLRVQNGPLVLEIPENYNAELETGTINGPMTLGFPVMVQGRIGAGSRRHLTTTLGRGGVRIRAVTTNGPAVIRRS